MTGAVAALQRPGQGDKPSLGRIVRAALSRKSRWGRRQEDEQSCAAKQPAGAAVEAAKEAAVESGQSEKKKKKRQCKDYSRF